MITLTCFYGVCVLCTRSRCGVGHRTGGHNFLAEYRKYNVIKFNIYPHPLICNPKKIQTPKRILSMRQVTGGGFSEDQGSFSAVKLIVSLQYQSSHTHPAQPHIPNTFPHYIYLFNCLLCYLEILLSYTMG